MTTTYFVLLCILAGLFLVWLVAKLRLDAYMCRTEREAWLRHMDSCREDRDKLVEKILNPDQ